MSRDDHDIYRELGRMIRGEVTSAEIKRIAEAEGFKSFSELCGTRLPEELGKVRLSTRDLVARLDEVRRRAIDLHELWFWADELYNISFNHRIAYEPRSEDLIISALSAISVVANERLFPNHQKTARALDYIRACLLKRRKFRVRNIFLRIFEDLEHATLANKTAAESPDDAEGDAAWAGPEGAARRWADVVLLDRPFDPGADIYLDYNWMIAFTVSTRELHEEERAEAERGAEGDEMEPPAIGENGPIEGAELAGAPEEAGFCFEIPGWRDGDDEGDEARLGAPSVRPPAMRPTPREEGEDVDRVPALRRLVPNFDFARYQPRYLHDGDGIAEIILDAPSIGREELRYAARLFCLANRIRACTLDGEPLKTLVVRPGAGRRSGSGERSKKE